MSALPVQYLFDTEQPFTRSDARAAGISDFELASDSFVRLFHGVYISRSTTRTLPIRARAALLLAPPAATVSHHTAALLWGGVVPRQSAIHLTVPAKAHCQVVGVRTHRYASLGPVTYQRGVRVTSPERTLCDLARTLDLVELVALGDRLVRREATTPERLVSAAGEWRGAYAPLIRRATSLVRAGVDSPPESRLRMLVVLAGLPEPTVNHVVRDLHTGAWLRRFELAYRELRIALEYQGRWHFESEDVWTADMDRRDEVGRDSWRLVEVSALGLGEHPLRTLQRIEAARVDRGAAPTRRLRDEWRAFFPGTAPAQSSARR